MITLGSPSKLLANRIESDMKISRKATMGPKITSDQPVNNLDSTDGQMICRVTQKSPLDFDNQSQAFFKEKE